MPKKGDDIFKDLREHSIAEFFRKNKQMLGYSGAIRSLTTIVHELVTNSLDACEESNITPNIMVKIEQHDDVITMHCKDNGPGIPKKHISNVFGKMLSGTKFHRNVQLRGQQGIGVAGATMFSQMTTGKPVEIITSTKREAIDVELMINISKNKADIINQQDLGIQEETGTEFIAKFKEVNYSTREQGPYEYLRRTAIANPHTEITFVSPEGDRVTFPRTTEEIPKKPVEIMPHPKGISVDDLIILARKSKSRSLKTLLKSELSRVSAAKASEVQEHVDFDINKKPKRLTWEEAEQVVKAFKKMKFLAPATDCLRPIGGEKIEAEMHSILAPEFLAVVERKPTVYGGGYPFQVEVGIAYGGRAGRKLASGETRSEVMRFANRAPLLFDTGGCAITKAVQNVEWKRYGLKDIDNSPATIFVNLISTHIPYTSAGKQSVSDEIEILDEIRFALMDVGRKFSSFHSKKRKAKEHSVRRDKLLRYVTEIVPPLSEITGKSREEIKPKWDSLVESHVGQTIEELKEEIKAEEEEEAPEALMKRPDEDESIEDGETDEDGKPEGGRNENDDEEVRVSEQEDRGDVTSEDEEGGDVTGEDEEGGDVTSEDDGVEETIVEENENPGEKHADYEEPAPKGYTLKDYI